MIASLLRRLDCTRREGGGVPAAVVYIVSNEAAERFAFYGARACVTLYFTDGLGYSEPTAVSLYSWFMAACYIAPLLGGWVADSRWGRYATILVFNAAYLLGLFALSGTAFVSSAVGCFLGLFAMAVGTGGIKSNISVFAVDNLGRSATEEQKTSLFFWFYFAVNLGSAFSYVFTPLVRSAGGFGWAFMLSAFMLSLSIVVLLAAHRQYVFVPPSGRSVYGAAGRVMYAACTRRAAPSPPAQQLPALPRWLEVVLGRAPGDADVVLSSGGALKSTEALPLIDAASADAAQQVVADAGRASPTAYGSTGSAQRAAADADSGASGSGSADMSGAAAPADTQTLLGSSRERSCIDAARGRVDAREFTDVRATLRLLPLFLMLPVFWALFDSQGSIWPLQRKHMDNCIGAVESRARVCLTPEQLGALNPVLVLLLVPLFTRVVFPALRALPWRWAHPTPLRRMCVGMQLAAASFLLTAAVQGKVDAAPDGSVSALWQLPQIVVITASELLVSTTGLEFAYSQAPVSAKGSIIAIFYVAVSLGNVLTGALYSGLSSVLTPLQLILLLAALMALAGLVFIGLAWAYVPVPSADTPSHVTATGSKPEAKPAQLAPVAAAAAAPDVDDDENDIHGGGNEREERHV